MDTKFLTPPTAPEPAEKPVEVLVLETMIATLNEANVGLTHRLNVLKAMKGSRYARAAGVCDAIEIVEGMRNRIIWEVLEAKNKAKLMAKSVAPLPPGLLVLTPEEVAARESKGLAVIPGNQRD